MAEQNTNILEKIGLPDGWQIIDFESCLSKVKFGRDKQIPAKEYLENGEFPIIDQGQKPIAWYTNDESKIINDGLPFIIFWDHTRAVKYITSPIALGADWTKLIKPTNEFDPRFFYFQLLFIDVPSRWYNRHFPLLKERKILKPQISEQQAISETLSSLQSAISEQRNLIEKLRELKRSMMHELFTRGTHGEQVKVRDIGEIPESWKITELGEVVNFTTGKLNSNAAEIGGIYPFFTCSQETFKINNYAFDCEALLLSGNNARAVYSVKHFIGKFNAYQRTYVITLKNPSNNNYLFMKYLLEMSLERFQWLSIGSSTKYLTLGILQSLKIWIPDTKEQFIIGETINSIDQKVEVQTEKLNSLESLFKTLLHELMSGERRVI